MVFAETPLWSFEGPFQEGLVKDLDGMLREMAERQARAERHAVDEGYVGPVGHGVVLVGGLSRPVQEEAGRDLGIRAAGNEHYDAADPLRARPDPRAVRVERAGA